MSDDEDFDDCSEKLTDIQLVSIISFIRFIGRFRNMFENANLKRQLTISTLLFYRALLRIM
jgi:hypothetical protein